MKFVILAGGSGTRLWPLSRKNAPKQFIALENEYSMLQNTAARVTKDDGADVFVISSLDSKFTVMDQMALMFQNFKESQIIVEPVGRNTAPAIAYGMQFLQPDDVVAVLSSDHHIGNDEEFVRILNEAEEIARQQKIVTIGIVPDSPKTGYGYIKKTSSTIGEGFMVERFVEKPNRENAMAYLQEGGYYWNAGMFVFQVSFFMEQLKTYAPEIAEIAQKLGNKAKTEGQDSIKVNEYSEFPKISIDYALMEKTKEIVVVPGDFDWSDVGSFQSLHEILPKDKKHNAIKMDNENFYGKDNKNLLVIGGKRKIAAIGTENLVIIDTPDALLVAKNDKSEQVKEIVEQMNDAAEVTNHLTVSRPWGTYTILDEGPNYKVKQLLIYPGKRISLQYHYHRSENWTVASGVAEVLLDDKIQVLKTSESIFIPAAVRHRLTNPSKVKVLKIIEVQTGEYLGEEDIIRLDDDYSR
jgi:mannose-1-phosphate guanylyltransferase/mannose-6-phosphate isomerase